MDKPTKRGKRLPYLLTPRELCDHAAMGKSRHVRLLGALIVLVAPSATRAADFTVSTVNDGAGSCTGTGPYSCTTLRAPITKANQLAGPDTITLAANGFGITDPGGFDDGTNSSGDFDILDDLTIIGVSSSTTLLGGNSKSRIFDVNPTNAKPTIKLTLRNLKLTGGKDAYAGTGGAIRNRAVIDLQGVAVESNYYSAIYNLGTATISNSTISNNHGAIGAAIYNQGTLTVSNTTIQSNSSAEFDRKGGAIYFDAGTATLTSCTISLNSNNGGTGDGGALYLASPQSNVTIDGGTLTSQQTQGALGGPTNGGAVFMAGGALTIRNATVSNNSSKLEGGAIVMLGGTLVVDNVLAGSNQANLADVAAGSPATLYGGGFLAASGDSTITITNSKFYGNVSKLRPWIEYSTGRGGAFTFRDVTGPIEISNSYFNKNVTEDSGGAIAIVDGSGPVRIWNSAFQTNTANLSGGAIYVARSAGPTVAMASLTVAGNSCGYTDVGFGGGVYAERGTVSLHNSVLADNDHQNGDEPDDFAANATALSLGYNAIETPFFGFTPTATDIVNLDPGLVPDSPSYQAVWEPTSASYLMDGGDPAGCTDPNGALIPFDIAGNYRTADGNGDGLARCDIGAVEIYFTSNVAFTSSVVYVSEADGVATITLRRSGTFTGALSVNYATSDDWSIAGVDYAASSGVVSWGVSDFADKSFTIPILQNTVYNVGRRRFDVNLSSNVALVAPPLSVEILDDEVNGAGSIELTSTTAQILEGTGGGTTKVTITARRVGGNLGDVSAKIATVSGTAVASNDFTGTSARLSWPSGSTVDQTFDVIINRDSEDEADEVFTVELSDPTGGATLGASVATVTIQDDDTSTPKPGTLQLDSATYSVGESDGTVTVSVSRTGGGDGQVTIDYALGTGGDTATAPADYVNKTGTLTWANGEQGAKTIQLTVKDDALDEADELFTFRLRGATITGGATLGSPGTAAITILDNDLPAPVGRISLSASTYSVGEAAGKITITARRTQGSNGQLDVHYYTTDVTATAAGLDYTPTSGVLSWPNGDAADKTFDVPINSDVLYEGDETFLVTLVDEGSPTPVTFGTSQATVTITDDDPKPLVPGVLSFASAAYATGEGSTRVVLVVGRTGGSDGRVTVQCSTTDGTALAPGDYTTQSRTLVWANGDTADKTCAVTIVDDNQVDPSEAFQVLLSNPSGGATLGAIPTATVTIVDNESPGTIAFELASYSALEGDGAINVTVQRLGGAAGAASVNYAATAGTAGSGDFTAVSGTLSWIDGDASTLTFTVPIKKDLLYENAETVNLTLSGATGATLGSPSAAVLTINDDDPVGGTIELTAATASVNETGPTITLKATRKGSTTGAVSVNFSTTDETATAVQDYTATSGTLNWADGVGGTKDIVILISNDGAAESDETFIVQLDHNSATTNLGRSAATVTILDNDGTPSTGTITLDAATYTRKENLALVTLSATRSAGTGPATIGWATSAGTATADVDYVESTGTLHWGDGQSGSKTFTIALLDDATYEGDETFTVTLSNPSNGISIGATAAATVTIKDDELAPVANGTVSFGLTSFVVHENDTVVQIPVSRLGGSTGAITVKCTAVAATATSPADFAATNATLSWTNGDTADKLCSIPIANDLVAEAGEAFTVTLNTPTGGATVGVGLATVSIVDDDTGGVIGFALADYVVGEEDGSITIELVRTGGSEGAVDVEYTTQYRAAKAGDFTKAAGTLHWDDGDAAPKSFVVTITPDFVYEGDEDFNIRLLGITGSARLGKPNQSVVIVDDDPPAGWIGLTKVVTTATEIDPSVTLQVTRKGSLTGAVSVSYTTSNQSATAGADYTLTAGTLNWADGVGGAQSIVVPILDDNAVEGDESFLLKLSNATGGAAIDRAVEKVTISDVETAGLVSLSSATYSIGESSGTLTITATRTVSFGGAVSVAYATSSGSATEGGDYTGASGTLSWANGESGSKTFNVSISPDGTPEGDETFSITLSNPTGGVGIGNSPATATIVDDDPFPDLASPDLVAPVDLKPSADLVSANDLATSADLAMPVDLARSADLTGSSADFLATGEDLAPSTDANAPIEGDLASAPSDLGVSTDQAGANPDLNGAVLDLSATAQPKSGCNCSTGASDPTASWLAALLVLGVVRRAPRRKSDTP